MAITKLPAGTNRGFTLISALLTLINIRVKLPDVKVQPRRGFTLIELLVSVAVLTTVVFIGIDLFTTIIRGNNKASVANEVRQNGQLAMSVLERNIRNATDVDIYNPPSCSNTLCIVKSDGSTLLIDCVDPNPGTGQNGRIDLDGVPITNNNASSGVNVSSCSVSVTTSPAAPKLVTINLVFEQSISAPTRKDFVASIPFNSTFSLRNKIQ